MVQIELESPDQVTRRHEPVTCGIPWPRGNLRDAVQLQLFDGGGEPVALQARALERWSDGSIRWCLLDWQAVVETRVTYRAEIGQSQSPTPEIHSPRIRTALEAGRLTIDTEAACFTIRSGGTFPFEAVTVAGRPAIDPARTRLVVESERGEAFQPRAEEFELIEPGPLRVVVRVEGSLDTASRRPWCRYFADMHFFAGQAVVRFDLTLHNPRRAEHPGNLWGLGDRGSIYIRDAAMTLALPSDAGPADLRFSPEPTAPFRAGAPPLELYQDSSGGENWRGTIHVNRDLGVPNTFRGYRLVTPDGEEQGLRATPIVLLESANRRLGLAMEHFWQNFPKAVEAAPDSLTLRLFPRQYADVHELQGGEQKTHTFFAAFAPDNVTDEPLSWCRTPIRPRATPEWYCSSRAIVPHLIPRSADPHSLYLELVDAGIEGEDTFERKREAIDEYGWRHFGDIYGDHEAVFHEGPNRLVSHYNNQYDPIAGFALQFLRSGDWRWWRLMHEQALHVRDIDIYHTDEDKSGYNHGLFWHTCHYVDAGTSTHRSHPPRTASVHGGGPSGGHNYATGLMLHHFLTGEHLSRAAAIELARWTIDMDDGRKTVFRWLVGGYTGHATLSGSVAGHGPGRASGNSLNTLLDGYRLTSDRAFLEKAEQVIRRAVHPADDIPARDLLDAENKWFYTMFLQALGRYLHLKAERKQLDPMYAYARASLLNYARWMADHEYPYLDKPEILEYPTETWAAQDMRKSEVFEAAAQAAETPEERERFLERSRFFFESSTTTLARMPTRTLARPMVLLLSNGLARAASALDPPEPCLPTPAADPDFGPRMDFIPQKAMAMRRFRLLALVTGVVAAVVAIAAAVLSLN